MLENKAKFIKKQQKQNMFLKQQEYYLIFINNYIKKLKLQNKMNNCFQNCRTLYTLQNELENQQFSFCLPVQDSISMLNQIFQSTQQIEQDQEMMTLPNPFEQLYNQNDNQKNQCHSQNEKSTQLKQTQIYDHSSRINQDFSLIQESNESQYINDKKPKIKQNAQTKNIPKNFGRAIISFILSNHDVVRKVFENSDQKSVKSFITSLTKMKKTVKTISGIRNMWLDQKNNYAKQVRILSQLFLRKYCLGYIFNSRIKNYPLNIKYRRKMLQSILKPGQFTSLKDF